jgi:LDH2 family malate/lactate/ureidoglycolate dehydrogenase
VGRFAGGAEKRMTGKRYPAAELRRFAADLLLRMDMDADMARAMSERIVDAELFGYRTHGFGFMPAYLERIEKGMLALSGSWEILADRGGAFAWKCDRLPGAWVMEKATAELVQRATRHGVATATIAKCSHIGCLQAYLLPFTERGLAVSLAVTNPGIRSVAPFGGADALLTTNPMAYGFPTSGIPVLVDQSTSLASNAFFAGYAARKERLPGEWLLDADGAPTDDPNVLSAKPAGTILPLGGLDFGYKGFGFGIAVEALALGLSGYGRAQKPDAFGQSVFVQAIDPAAFAGREAFLKEMDHLVAACRASRPRPGVERVRVPGERALASRAEQEKNGVAVPAASLAKLEPWMKKLGVNLNGGDA